MNAVDDGATMLGDLGPGAGARLSASPDELAAGTMIGEFRVEARLGQGGMGTVYGARHPLIGKRAAIKVIRRDLSSDREAVERFMLEAQSVNQIGHPNIVDIFAFGTLYDGRCYFVMEWLAGESVASRMHHPVPLGEAVGIVDEIARALEAAHAAGVIHRDLKPDNVFLVKLRGEPVRVKLLDFGLAKLSTSEPGVGRTRTGFVMGTPLYLSPEQARGARIDTSTDVYSLGVMTYELVTGMAPFMADSAVEIMSLHISEPPPPLRGMHPELPPEVEAIVMAMMAKEREARPTLAQVRAALAPFAGSTAVPPHWEPAAMELASGQSSSRRSSARRTAPPSVQRWPSMQARRRRGLAVALAAAAVVTAVVIAAVAMAVTPSATPDAAAPAATSQAVDAGVVDATPSAAVAVEAPVEAATEAAAGAAVDAAVAATPPVERKRGRRRPKPRPGPESKREESLDVNAVLDPFAP